MQKLHQVFDLFLVPVDNFLPHDKAPSIYFIKKKNLVTA